jgi:hypothetical protein
MSQEIITDLSTEPISWIIDREGDYSLINQLYFNHYRRNYNSINLSTSGSNYLISNNYINNSIINTDIYDDIYDDISYHPFSHSLSLFTSLRSVPSELVLNQDIQFSEEQCECCICMDQNEAENICQLNCGHTFCVTCIDTSLKTFKDRNKDVICALCRTEVTKITFKKQENKDKIQECLI